MIQLLSNLRYKVLKQEHALLPKCDGMPLNTNHLGMARCSGISDSRYQAVAHVVKSMYCMIESNLRVFLSSIPTLDPLGHVRNLPITPDGREDFIASISGDRIARDMGRLALTLEDQGSYREALKQYCKAADYFEKSLGSEHFMTLFCRNKEASLTYNVGDFKAAGSLSKSLVERYSQSLGETALHFLLSCCTFAQCLEKLGERKVAFALLQDALENTSTSSFELFTMPARTKLLNCLAKIALELEMADVARTAAEECLRLSISLYGQKHSFSLKCMIDLATSISWDDDPAVAENLIRLGLDGLEQSLGTTHPDSLRASQQLARFLLFRGHPNEASIRLRQILYVQTELLELHHPDTVLTMANLGVVYVLQGYEKDADSMLQQALRAQEKLLGDNHEKTQQTNCILEVLRAQHDKPRREPDITRIPSLPELPLLSGTENSSKVPWKQYHFDTIFTASSDNAMVAAAAEGNLKELQTIVRKLDPTKAVFARGLREAAARGQHRVISVLLDNETPVDGIGGFHGTALLSASAAGDLAALGLLLQRKADPTVEGGIFGNVLKAAIANKHGSVVDFLLAENMRDKIKTFHKNSALFTAITTRQSLIVEKVLSAGADPNAIDAVFGSPFHHAVLTRQKNIQRILLAKGAKTDRPDFGLLVNAFNLTLSVQATSAHDANDARSKWIETILKLFPLQYEDTTQDKSYDHDEILSSMPYEGTKKSSPFAEPVHSTGTISQQSMRSAKSNNSAWGPDSKLKSDASKPASTSISDLVLKPDPVPRSDLVSKPNSAPNPSPAGYSSSSRPRSVSNSRAVDEARQPSYSRRHMKLPISHSRKKQRSMGLNDKLGRLRRLIPNALRFRPKR